MSQPVVKAVDLYAISALDIALWDLFARSEGKPLHHYFGGLKHQRLPAYATIYPMAAEPEAFKAQIGPYLEQGFRRLKICVESWWQDIDATIENLSQLRAFVGPEIELMLDVAMEFTRYEQLEPFIRLLEELDFKWIEAPFELDNLADHRRLKTETYLPVGVGDLGFTTVKEFIPYLDADAFDIAQPDITLFGGVSEMIKLQALLQPAGKRIVPHGYNTEITLALNCHFLAAQPLVEPLEYSTSPSILRQKLISNPIRINAEGMAEVPEECIGLGIELNWDLVKRCSA